MKKTRRGQQAARPTAAGATPPVPPARPAAPPATVAVAPPRPVTILDRLASALPQLSLLVVAVFAIRRLEDFDTWWHLASGRWIAEHHAIPYTDVLSHTVPQNEWVNLQWLYDLLLYFGWTIGGPNLLVLASAATFIGSFALIARNLRRHLGPIATTLLLVWVATTVNERFLIRPEMASFPLLAAVQLLLAGGRDDARKLRWLAPLMMLWANMHSLFILGVGAIACAIAGAFVAEIPLLPAAWRIDSRWPRQARRQLVIWSCVAIAATLVNPYLLRALLFPLELITRINGSSGVYSSIGEFRPPFSGYFLTFAIGSYQAFVVTAAALAVVAGLVRALARPARAPAQERSEGFDLGALAFAAALAWLSLLARRNVGIFAVGAVPFVGACLGIVLARLPKWLQSPGPLAVRTASIAMLAGMLLICTSVVTNDWYARTGETHEFGLGTIEANSQPRATAFFREHRLPGPIYNDMTAGGYLTWDDPSGKGVYVDGRLEVYDTAFFGTYLSNMGNIEAWRRDADARGIQSAMVFHRWGNRHGFIRALLSTPEWRLAYYDETVAIFVRSGANDGLIEAARAAFSSTWRERNEKVLSDPPQTFSWQWSIGRYTGQLAYARLLETVGDKQGALEWFEAAIAGGLPAGFDIEARQRAAAHLVSAGQFAQARMHLQKALQDDPANQSTRSMLARLDAIAH